MSYNPLPFSYLANALIPAGFQQNIVNREIVFDRAHAAESRLFIRVYTSNGVEEEQVRKRGSDAIRVCLLYVHEEKIIGVARFTRVHRTGTSEAIVRRMLARCQEANNLANQMLAERCLCGAPLFADSKKCIVHCNKMVDIAQSSVVLLHYIVKEK